MLDHIELLEKDSEEVHDWVIASARERYKRSRLRANMRELAKSFGLTDNQIKHLY
jgi:hypothetical protein